MSNLTAFLLNFLRNYDATTLSVLVMSRAKEASYAMKMLTQSGAIVWYFPDRETLPYDNFSPGPNVTSTRLETLYRLQQAERGVVVTSIDAILPKLPTADFLDAHGLVVKVGDRLAIGDLAARLTQAGYQLVPQVREKGEFARRGSILDVFPSGAKLPIRFDFFDDEVEGLRVFDVKTQMTAAKIDSVDVLPSREIDLSDAGRVCFRQNMRQWLDDAVDRHPVYQKVSNNEAVSGLENYLPLFFDNVAQFNDYLPAKATVYSPVDETAQFVEKYRAQFDQVVARYLRMNVATTLLPPERLFVTPEQAQPLITRVQVLSTPEHEQEVIEFMGKISERFEQLSELLDRYPNTLIACRSIGQIQLLQSRLSPSLPEVTWTKWFSTQTSQAVAEAFIETSLVLGDNTLIINAEDIFDNDIVEINEDDDVAGLIQDLSQLQIGDPVVHRDHGVGRYAGLELVEIDDEVNEYITVRYANNEKLYIPVSALEAITRYSGASAENAPLHRLDGKQWEKAKSKAQKRIVDTAATLLEIYAKREAAHSESIEIDMDAMAEFADAFPYEPTPDQRKAFNAVFADLRATQPMDRIVCGDVGFGKTEVAMRAAFAVAMAGKQVALLVPTTLLAEQHLHNFTERFAGYPFRIVGLSRFKTASEQKDTLAELVNGQADIVIGTHRIIQKDMQFKQLGLVIIDEEHKFGVKQKEMLKQLRAEVNILTLTATPIPRTLSMSMSGLRDLSIIASPPPKRTPIHTIFSRFDDGLIAEGIQRELARGGQVYFVHNDIRSMSRIEELLSELFPDNEARIAHGQMSEGKLEQIMADFYHQRFEILIATTIIESGIDNPNANTIFINRADKFGLAQLHQLRGRVGRSHHQAYAYLLTPDESIMTSDAQKRMAALASLKGLGVGFMLASNDLEIRGAGELLGDNQSGQITEIGFGLYNEMLAQTIKAMKHNKALRADVAHCDTEVDLGVTSIIPDAYLFDVHTRLVFYKRIASAKSERSLDQIQMEMIDRFGLLPIETKHLFLSAELKLVVREMGVKKVVFDDDKISVSLFKQHEFDADALLRLITLDPMRYKIRSPERFDIIRQHPNIDDAVANFREWLRQFSD